MVEPSTAEIHVDGVYAGRIADFDGRHKHL